MVDEVIKAAIRKAERAGFKLAAAPSYHVLFYLARELAFAGVLHANKSQPAPLPLRRWLRELGFDRLCLAANANRRRCCRPIDHTGAHFTFRYSPQLTESELEALLFTPLTARAGAGSWWEATDEVCGAAHFDGEDEPLILCQFRQDHGGYHSWEHPL